MVNSRVWTEREINKIPFLDYRLSKANSGVHQLVIVVVLNKLYSTQSSGSNWFYILKFIYSFLKFLSFNMSTQSSYPFVYLVCWHMNLVCWTVERTVSYCIKNYQSYVNDTRSTMTNPFFPVLYGWPQGLAQVSGACEGLPAMHHGVQ